MYHILLTLHSLVRWIALFLVMIAILRAISGVFGNRKFNSTDDLIRHWSATATHIQMLVGILLYTQSPLTKLYWQSRGLQGRPFDLDFFGIIHIALMLTAIIVLTVGSALAKRRLVDRQKHRTVLIWFSIAMFIIFIAIPWPFSPLANRPYFRIS